MSVQPVAVSSEKGFQFSQGTKDAIKGGVVVVAEATAAVAFSLPVIRELSPEQKGAARFVAVAIARDTAEGSVKAVEKSVDVSGKAIDKSTEVAGKAVEKSAEVSGRFFGGE